MVVFILSVMFQSKVATRTGMRCTLAYHVDAGTRARNHVYMKNDSLV